MKKIKDLAEKFLHIKPAPKAWVPYMFDSRNLPELRKPFSNQTLTYVLILIVFLLALLAGYYHALFLAENKKYRRLEDRYVRVREELGREAMQDLIDASYE